MYSILQSYNANTEKTAHDSMIATRGTTKAVDPQEYPTVDFLHQVYK